MRGERGDRRSRSTTRSFTFDSGHTVSGDPLAREPLDQRRVLDAAHAVVDALDVQHVERLPDVRGRPLLAGVGDAVQAARPRARAKTRANFSGGLPTLARVEADADEVLAVRQRLRRASSSAASALEVAQEAQDQLAR